MSRCSFVFLEGTKTRDDHLPSTIFFNPLVITLAALVLILIIVIIVLVAWRWRRHACTKRKVAAPVTSITSSSCKATTVEIDASHIYAVTDTPPRYVDGFRDRAESSAMDSLLYEDGANQHSTTTDSTKFSSSEGSLKTPGSVMTTPVPVVVGRCGRRGRGNYPDDIHESADDTKSHCEDSTSSSVTSSTDDVKGGDKVSVTSAQVDSDVDACFLSSKRLIDKKKRNRRSAGDELEHSLLAGGGGPRGRPATTTTDPQFGVMNINRRSW